MFYRIVLFPLLWFLLGCIDVPKFLSKINLSFINDVKFNNQLNNNNNIGNGFIVKHNGNHYAITAKHILILLNSDGLPTNAFVESIEQWKMFNKGNSDAYIEIDKPISIDNGTILDWTALEKDWTVFSIKNNRSNNMALSIRKEPLIKGENLYVVGWAYEDKLGPQRIYKYSYEQTENAKHVIKQLKGPENLAGLSGSPVVDEQLHLVGIVSTGWKDDKNQQVFIEASAASDILAFLDQYSSNHSEQ